MGVATTSSRPASATRCPRTCQRPSGPSASRRCSSRSVGPATRRPALDRPPRPAAAGRDDADPEAAPPPDGSTGTSASAAGRSLRQSASGASRTSSFVRPDFTDCGWSSGLQPGWAASSRLCSSSHWLRPRPSAPVRTSTNRPASLWPLRSKCSSPPAIAAAGSSVRAGTHVPRSHTMTSPPPYSPDGITPSKSAYSIGWSSTCTARLRVAGSRVGPLGTAQLASTPSTSRRRS